MSTETLQPDAADERDGSTSPGLANALGAFMLAIVLSSSVPDVHVPETRTTCSSVADVVAHQARSHHGVSITCTERKAALASR